MQFSISSKSFFRQLASRSVRSTRPVAFFRRKGAAGISRLAEISVYVSYTRLDAESYLMRCRFVNDTDLSQNCILNILDRKSVV